MKIQDVFGRNVRQTRESRGLSQEGLSERSGLHRTYISGIERGVRNPTIEIAGRIAIALEVDLTALLRRDS